MEMFRVVGVGPRSVRLVFDQPMLANSAFSDPTSYAVTGVGGVSVGVVGVRVEQPTSPLSVILTTVTDLGTTDWYVVALGPSVVTALGAPVVPNDATFQWVEAARQVSVGLHEFTGGAHGDLFGDSAGLVFFSPALEQALSNSAIEVDEVSVCTTASDSYEFPRPIDPTALFTWGPNNPPSLLGQPNVVLWGAFPRLSEARVEVTNRVSETVLPPEDGPATATFQEPWDQTYVALLNNTHWQLFPATGSGAAFITASNLAPIPPGPVVTVVLEP